MQDVEFYSAFYGNLEPDPPNEQRRRRKGTDCNSEAIDVCRLKGSNDIGEDVRTFEKV